MDLEPKIEVQNLNFYYGEKQALKDVNVVCAEHRVTALIGPSGCGKSTFIRTLNRMNDVIPGARVEGEIRLDGEDLNAPGGRRGGAPEKSGHGFSKGEPVSEVHF